MSLSIIIPTLNEAENIDATLRALAPLRARGAEVIVVDGGSTDDTVARARPLADLVLRGAARTGAADERRRRARARRDPALPARRQRAAGARPTR